MKKVVALLLCALPCLAADPVVPLRVDLNTTHKPFELTVYQAEQTKLRVYLYNDGAIWTGATNYIDNTGKIGYVSSSQRYKKNITDTTDDDYTKLLSVRPRKYDRADDSVIGEYGLVAEEVDALNLGVPGLVSYVRLTHVSTNEAGEEVISYTDDVTKPETVNMTRLIPLLLDAVRRQQAEIEELNRRMQAIEQ